jgi:hypothetical protein
MKTASWIALGLISTVSLAFTQEKPRLGGVAYTVRELPTASGADFLEPRRINNRGEVLGKLDFSTGPFLDDPHAGFFSGGTTIDLHLLVPGYETNDSSLPVDLNDRGQLIFRAYDGVPWDRFFLYGPGQFIELNEMLGRNDLDILALNNAGSFVGTTIVNNDVGQAFLYARGRFETLGLLPGYPNSVASAINDHHLIGGWAGDAETDDAERSVLFRPSRVIDLGIPMSYVIDINNRGDVLGNSYLRRRGGKVIPLPFAPQGFNDRAQVVGSNMADSPDARAMIFLDGQTHDLNDLIDPASGWRLIHAYDINDRGQIAGWGRVNGHWAGFILDPRKER